MKVERITPAEWINFGPEAHLICFNEKRDAQDDRIDFALIAANDQPLAYMTCRELDAKTVYLQYGGAFPSAKDSVLSFRAYTAMLKALKDAGYLIAGTYIENKNKVMLKFAMKAGWFITGVRTFDGSVMLEHQMKLQEDLCRGYC